MPQITGVIVLESLKIFVAAAESGSINRAAEACFITPPAAMKRLNALEDELGVKLLARSGRGVALTRAGESYLSDAVAILKAAEEATARARRAAEGVLLLSLDYWKDVHPSIVSVPLKVNASQAYGIIYAADAPAEVRKFISAVEEQARRG